MHPDRLAILEYSSTAEEMGRELQLFKTNRGSYKDKATDEAVAMCLDRIDMIAKNHHDYMRQLEEKREKALEDRQNSSKSTESGGSDNHNSGSSH